jgi:hypothetical protein
MQPTPPLSFGERRQQQNFSLIDSFHHKKGNGPSATAARFFFRQRNQRSELNPTLPMAKTLTHPPDNNKAASTDLSQLPGWLRTRLASCPRRPRKGIHPWLFFTARRLLAYLDEAAIFELLWTRTRDRGRFVSAKEIKAQIENAGTSLEQSPNGRRSP